MYGYKVSVLQDYIEKCRQLDTHGRALAMLKTQVDELLAAQIAQQAAKSTVVDFNSLAEGLRCCENRLTLIENRLTLLEVKVSCEDSRL